VGDLMHSGELLPQVGIDATISQALLEVSRKGLGMTAVVDAKGCLPVCSPMVTCAAFWTCRWIFITPRSAAS
jgi:hypothetical protein